MNIKDLKPLDYIIIVALIVVVAIGALVLLGKNKFSKSPVEATKKIAFQVMVRGVTITDSKLPFKIGDESFITIRNVPYTKLQVVDVVAQTRKTIIPINNTQQPFAVIDDYSQPYQYDLLVTLIDDAKITKDGAVAGGNKVKIGLPIVLEGFNYRIGGTISNVQVLENKDVDAINKFVQEQKLIQNVQEANAVAVKKQDLQPKTETSEKSIDLKNKAPKEEVK